MGSINDEKTVDKIIKKGGESSLIAILQEVQSHYNYLPEQVLTLLSKKLEIPLSKIFSLATFYRSFSLKPRGKNLLKVCLGTACHVKNGTNLLEKVKRDLSLSEEETTTSDLVFTVEKVRCLGCCSLAPVVSVNEDTHGSMTQEKMSKVLKKYL
ncbi:MAG: NAD(P)H-dependent oxidoreductase subunit E [Deltaproteobacteria bacterium]|jgi:NADH-quinone oxidoreductase subunit E|nr:NAD(P)H-dependent oxidoreductase subunit E [Deltaproteobacteria bacterium]